MADDSDLDESLIEFFKGGNIKAMERVLARAYKKAEAAQRKKAGAGEVSRKASLLTKALNTAMSSYGRSTKNAPSIRQKAPDTGGRPYHFAYSTMAKNGGRGRSKGPSGPAAGGAPGAAGSGGVGGPGTGPGRGGGAAGAKGKATKGGAKSKRANTAEAAHQIYTERDGAVDHEAPALDATREAEVAEALAQDRAAGPVRSRGDGPDAGVDAPEVDEPEIGGSPRDRQERSRAFVEGFGRDAGLERAGSEAAAQAYIENPDKIPALQGKQSSFGTIGDTLEERLAFWDLVHEKESDKGGRTQTRMVLELPHEATAAQRHEIVRLFTDDLRKKGIPFWASIHAPTRNNDQRNFHAHIVCTDRPMRQMPHPETGEMAWDFSIAVVTTKRVSGNKVTSHPYRQNRDPEMRDRGYVKKARARLSDVVNQVMAKSGTEVRYDPRSYKDMGLDVEPMKNVTRILADKLDKKSFVVMDADWTRRMVDAEMTAAGARRSAAFVKLQESELELARLARQAEKDKAANLKLPKERRLSPLRQMTKAASQTALQGMARMRRNRLAVTFLDESIGAALGHVVAATSPEAVGKRAHGTGTAPNREDLAALHAAALEELAEHGGGSRLRAQSMQQREKQAEKEWREGPPRTDGLQPQDASRPMQASAQGTPMQDAASERQAQPSSQMAPTEDRRQVPGVPILPGRPGYAQEQSRRSGHVARDETRTDPGAYIRNSMNAFVQPFIEMGLSGQDFTDAMQEMMRELTGGRWGAQQPTQQPTKSREDVAPQASPTASKASGPSVQPKRAEPTVGSTDRKQDGQATTPPRAETTPPAGRAPAPAPAPEQNRTPTTPQVRNTGAPQIPRSIQSRVRVVAKDEPTPTPIPTPAPAKTPPSRPAPAAASKAPQVAQPTVARPPDQKGTTTQPPAVKLPGPAAPGFGVAAKSDSNAPGQAGQPSAFPRPAAAPQEPTARETSAERLIRLGGLKREPDRAAELTGSAERVNPKEASVKDPMSAAAAPTAAEPAAAAVEELPETAEAAAKRKAEEARRRRQALLARRIQSGPER